MSQLDKILNSVIIVTGAAGFIGYHLSKILLSSNNIHVIGIDNLNNYYDPQLKQARLRDLQKFSNFTFHHTDLANQDDILSIFEKANADYVVHLAAQAGVRYCIDNPNSYTHSNLVGHMNILEAIRKFPPIHTVYASSSSVYGRIDQMPFSADMKTDMPASLYAATKKSCELLSYSYADMYDLALTGLRFFTVYGPYGRPDMAYFKFTQKILNNQAIDVYNHGQMLRDFTYIDDITEGVLRCIPLSFSAENTTRHRVFNIGNNQPESLEKMISLLEENLGKKAIRNLLPMQTGDVKATYADIEPLAALTAFQPKTSLEVGLKKFISWYRDFYRLN